MPSSRLLHTKVLYSRKLAVLEYRMCTAQRVLRKRSFSKLRLNKESDSILRGMVLPDAVGRRRAIDFENSCDSLAVATEDFDLASSARGHHLQKGLEEGHLKKTRADSHSHIVHPIVQVRVTALEAMVDEACEL